MYCKIKRKVNNHMHLKSAVPTYNVLILCNLIYMSYSDWCTSTYVIVCSNLCTRTYMHILTSSRLTSSSTSSLNHLQNLVRAPGGGSGVFTVLALAARHWTVQQVALGTATLILSTGSAASVGTLYWQCQREAGDTSPPNLFVQSALEEICRQLEPIFCSSDWL